MTARRAMSSNNLRRTLTKTSIESPESPLESRNPLVRIISSFNSRESAGWRALQNIPTTLHDSGSTSVSPHSSINHSTPTSHQIDILSPRSDTTTSTSSTPRIDPITRIDISTPRVVIDDRGAGEVASPRTLIVGPTHSPTSQFISTMPIESITKNVNLTPNRGRSNTMNSKTPRNVVPIFRQDSRWHSLQLVTTSGTTNTSGGHSTSGGNSPPSNVDSPSSSETISPRTVRPVRALIPPLRIPNGDPSNSLSSPLSKSNPNFSPISPTRQSPQSGRPHSRARNYMLSSTEGSLVSGPASPATQSFHSTNSYSSTSHGSVSRESSLFSLPSFSPPSTPLTTSSSNQSNRTARTNFSSSTGSSSHSSGTSSSGASDSSGNSKSSSSAETSEYRPRRRLSVVIPSPSSSESMALSPMNHVGVSPSSVYVYPPVLVVPPSPMGTPTDYAVSCIATFFFLKVLEY